MENRIAKTSLFLCITYLVVLCTCQMDDNVDNELSNAQEALKEYRTACQRLQNMANWMSVFLKLKSAWTNGTASSMMAGLEYKGVVGFINVPELPERPAMDKNSSECRSMKNLHVTLQTFIHYQVQLLQLKAVLANLLVKSSLSRIDDTNESLKRRLGNLENLNNTLVEIFDKLKQSQIVLSAQDTLKEPTIQSFKNSVYLKGQNLSSYLLQSQSSILGQIQTAINTTQEQKWTRTLFQTGDFFQNMGQALDRFFTSKLADQSEPR